MLENSSGVDSKRLYLSSEKEKENCCLVLMPSTKCKTRKFHVLVMQRQQKNLQRNVRNAGARF